jgi:hypothetical protein
MIGVIKKEIQKYCRKTINQEQHQTKNNMSALDQLKKHTVVVADTGLF